MLRAILLDLDNTLLSNAMETFLPAYFAALSSYVRDVVPPSRLICQLERAIDAMHARSHEGSTNEEAFASVFYPALGADRSSLEEVFERFYVEEFPKLKGLTKQRPAARPLVEWALQEGLQVVVATNPLFPRVAVEERLVWAGVPADEIDYALVTTYENMHATKSHPAYYREIANRLGRQPGECLMVGDSWAMDVVPAASLGMHVYWIAEVSEPPLSSVPLLGHGTLTELWERAQSRGSRLVQLTNSATHGKAAGQKRRSYGVNGL